MKRSALVGIQFKSEARCGGQSGGVSWSHPLVANPLPRIEIDIEFEELEEKLAPQSDTSYLLGGSFAGRRRA